MKNEPRRIPSGLWQRIIGTIFLLVGLFADLAATPFNGAASVATFCLSLSGLLLMWGALLFYLRIIEDKVARVLERLSDDQPD